MLRKKNIVLNQKKADGSEKTENRRYDPAVSGGRDHRKISENTGKTGGWKTGKSIRSWISVYEDEKVIFLNKPAGVLSQKAKETDVSLTEALGAYLSEKNAGEETMFRAGLCNRLDRNTSGLILAGKNRCGDAAAFRTDRRAGCWKILPDGCKRNRDRDRADPRIPHKK